MKIEVQEFYPLNNEENKTNSLGTLQVYIYGVEKPYDIRGIKIRKMKNGKYFFDLPNKVVFDEDGKKVKYPFFSYSDPKDQRKLIGLICKYGTEFLNKKFKEKKNDTKRLDSRK